MVTSFRPKSIYTKDESVLRGVKNISHVPTLYYQYSTYRLENMEDRVRDQVRSLRKRHNANANFDVEQVRSWLEKEGDFLNGMLEEIREL